MQAAVTVTPARIPELRGDILGEPLPHRPADYVDLDEFYRRYARPARRQAAAPDIPRAGRYFPPEEIARCTFGIVLDTSGSMSRTLLGKALGAIASYAESRDVPAARVVFCDAAPRGAGYPPVAEIAGRVRVRGRGGTLLQPGIDLLPRAEGFPPSAPVLVITDGYCDMLRIRREHAFLVPQAGSLPFTARGPVFRLRCGRGTAERSGASVSAGKPVANLRRAMDH
ncbi:hypothetical protein GCM10009753_00600 [Streptantibioticus ferralitis]